MAETQQDIDSLLAEVSALADQAVEQVNNDEAEAPASPSASPLQGPAASDDSYPTAPHSEPATTSKPNRADPSRILKIQVPVIVRLAERTMAMSDILAMTTGAIIEFDKPADGELDLLINNKCIGHGQAVKVGENFGLRVTGIGSMRDRIKAMGNGPAPEV